MDYSTFSYSVNYSYKYYKIPPSLFNNKIFKYYIYRKYGTIPKSMSKEISISRNFISEYGFSIFLNFYWKF